MVSIHYSYHFFSFFSIFLSFLYIVITKIFFGTEYFQILIHYSRIFSLIFNNWEITRNATSLYNMMKKFVVDIDIGSWTSYRPMLFRNYQGHLGHVWGYQRPICHCPWPFALRKWEPLTQIIRICTLLYSSGAMSIVVGTVDVGSMPTKPLL